MKGWKSCQTTNNGITYCQRPGWEITSHHHWKQLETNMFEKLQDKRQRCGSYDYANKKAWMDSRLMEEILRTLNKKRLADNQKILFFTDNAPSHPEFFIDFFFYGKTDFFPKHTISTLQSLDTGIIKKFKVFYCKQLLQHILSRT